jgi:hypothetical protein
MTGLSPKYKIRHKFRGIRLVPNTARAPDWSVGPRYLAQETGALTPWSSPSFSVPGRKE